MSEEELVQPPLPSEVAPDVMMKQLPKMRSKKILIKMVFTENRN